MQLTSRLMTLMNEREGGTWYTHSLSLDVNWCIIYVAFECGSLLHFVDNDIYIALADFTFNEV